MTHNADATRIWTDADEKRPDTASKQASATDVEILGAIEHPCRHASGSDEKVACVSRDQDRLSDDCDALTTAGEDDDPERGGGGAEGRRSSCSIAPSGRGGRGVVARLLRFLVPPPPPEDAGPPPDGGWAAWSTVICTHLVFANTWGFVNSFGIFQTYYADFLAPLPPSTISWIGSVQVFLTFFLSAISGRLSDAGYFRLCYWLGAGCMVVGLFGMSFCTRYWQLMLAQGFCVGTAGGLLCSPTMSIVSTYFQRRRSLALGIVTCGNVSGGLVYPAMARQLLPTVGFAWTLRAIGFMQLGMLVLAGLVIRPRVRAKKASPAGGGGGGGGTTIFDVKVFREPEFMLYMCGMVFNLGGTFVIYYYVASFGRAALDPVLSYPQSLNLLLIFNGIGIVGRLSAAFSADHVGPLNIIYPMAFVSAVCAFAWIAVRSQGGMYGWITVYGMVAGALQALLPAGLSSLTTDMSKIGQRLGMGFTFVGFSVIAGPPAAGAMVTAMGGRYEGLQAFAASLLVVGGCLIVAAKVARVRRTGSRWFDKI